MKRDPSIERHPFRERFGEWLLESEGRQLVGGKEVGHAYSLVIYLEVGNIVTLQC